MQYFFDSSALAKLYHAELGSEYIVSVLQDKTSRIFVSRLVLLELSSVAAIKVRTGSMSTEQADIFLRQLIVSTASGDFLVQRVGDDDYDTAAVLLERHARTQRLRTLDALHLASALKRQAKSGLDFFVTADQVLARLHHWKDCR